MGGFIDAGYVSLVLAMIAAVMGVGLMTVATSRFKRRADDDLDFMTGYNALAPFERAQG